ncbi:unnamed protein product [Echinostoma caproni]|uniref:Integrase_H2C2 domain-containing protein n=1 Tax=Echinostoma caproni TaxID=27848 RepID=A0A183B2A1_9TREM|nr:unnamed protein product [Echinostoma caproni]
MSRDDRLVIPPPLQKTVLEELRKGHVGVEKMESLAPQMCWWPELDADFYVTAKNSTENLVKTVKSAIASANPKRLHELETLLDNFLLQYRNATHSITKESPAMLFKSRRLRSSLQRVDSSDVVYFRGNDLRPAICIVTRQLDQAMVEITGLNDATVHKRHVDQIHFKPSTD